MTSINGYESAFSAIADKHLYLSLDDSEKVYETPYSMLKNKINPIDKTPITEQSLVDINVSNSIASYHNALTKQITHKFFQRQNLVSKQLLVIYCLKFLLFPHVQILSKT